MENFLLTKHPNFGEVKVKIENTEYLLAQVKGNGAVLKISSVGVELESLCLSKTDMKALFMLLYTEK